MKEMLNLKNKNIKVIILKKFKEKHEHIEIADIKFLETKNTLSEIKTSLDELNNRL